MLYNVTNQIIDLFDSYTKIDEHDYVMFMNSIILKCTSREIQEDRKNFENLLDALEIGLTRAAHQDGANIVNFEPLIEVFSNGRNSDFFETLVIILGYSLQPKYIDYLSAIETDAV